MSIKHVQKTYKDYGKADPLYAVLSCKDEKNNRWDVERFFETGQKEIRGARNLPQITLLSFFGF